MSTSYAKRLGGDLHKSHYLVAGVEGGIAQRRVNLANAQWGSQNDPDNPGNFNPNLPSGEFIDNENFMFPDFSAGLLWFSVLNERLSRIENNQKINNYIVVYIELKNGSYLPVKITQIDRNSFEGTMGEIDSDLPTKEQLQKKYDN